MATMASPNKFDLPADNYRLLYIIRKPPGIIELQEHFPRITQILKKTERFMVVEFDTKEAAAECMHSLKNSPPDEATYSVNYHARCTIRKEPGFFIKGLRPGTKLVDIKRAIPNTIYCQIGSGNNSSLAYVNFKSDATALKAFNNMKNIKICGRPVFVSHIPADNPRNKIFDSAAVPDSSLVNEEVRPQLCIVDLPFGTTFADLRALFPNASNISISVKKHQPDRRPVAYITYKTKLEAAEGFGSGRVTIKNEELDIVYSNRQTRLAKSRNVITRNVMDVDVKNIKNQCEAAFKDHVFAMVDRFIQEDIQSGFFDLYSEEEYEKL